jgi:hypothetical protein
MASYAYHADLAENEHLHYDDEEQLLSDIESKFDRSMSRLNKDRERKTRLLLEDYLEKRQVQQYHKDLYDPDLGDTSVSHL